MTTSIPTRGQLERSLLQQVQNLYREKLGQRPSGGICQLFDDKLTIVLQNTVAPLEKTLFDSGLEENVKKLRLEWQEAIETDLKALIQELVSTELLAILVDSDLESGYASITAILASSPEVRDPQSIPKSNRKRETNQEEES
jgi:uncharacterized protein YbcI